MSERKADPGTKSTLEIILEFGHKAIIKEKTAAQVKEKLMRMRKMFVMNTPLYFRLVTRMLLMTGRSGSRIRMTAR